MPHWFSRRASTQSRPMGALALGFAMLAALTSSAGAWLATESLPMGEWQRKALAGVLIIVSILMVAYERSALSNVRARRARGDNRAAFAGVVLLILAVSYTAIMQISFFGSMFLGAQAKDAGASSSLADVDKRLHELETRRSWGANAKDRGPGSTSAALREEIAGLERDEQLKGRDFAAKRQAAAAALPDKRRELAAALSFESIEAEMVDLRKKRSALIATPPADFKAAVIGAVFGLASEKVTYALIMLAVGIVQLGQVLLPTISGKSEMIAHAAKSAQLESAEATVTIEHRPQRQMAALPPARPALPPPAAAVSAEAALVAIAQRQAARAPKKAPSKATPKAKEPAPQRPAPTGLASRLR